MQGVLPQGQVVCEPRRAGGSGLGCRELEFSPREKGRSREPETQSERHRVRGCRGSSVLSRELGFSRGQELRDVGKEEAAGNPFRKGSAKHSEMMAGRDKQKMGSDSKDRRGACQEPGAEGWVRGVRL